MIKATFFVSSVLIRVNKSPNLFIKESTSVVIDLSILADGYIVTSERDYSISGLINERIANFKFTFVGFYLGSAEIYLTRLLVYCINVGAC